MNVASTHEVSRLLRNLRAEHDSAARYYTLADFKDHPRQIPLVRCAPGGILGL